MTATATARKLASDAPTSPAIPAIGHLPKLSLGRLAAITYRRPGQTSWSKALVRHGVDARVALGEALGVPAGDIRVRDRPE